MAEEFLEPIYDDAMVIFDLKRVVDYIRAHDNHHAVLGANALWEPLCNICKRYLGWCKEEGWELWSRVEKLRNVESDLTFYGDIIEKDILPGLYGYMRQWGHIEEETNNFLLESSESGFLTLKDLESNKYFHSTYDPMYEAYKMAESVYKPEKRAWSVLGCELGYFVYQLYQISNESAEITVYESDARMVEYARKYGVLDWIPEDKLKVVISDDVLDFLKSAEEEDIGYYMTPSAHDKVPEEDREALKGLIVYNNTYHRFRKEVTINFWRNVQSQVKLVSESDLSFAKEDAIVVAAGPSLDDNLDFLRKNKGKKAIIAVGTVFAKLVKSGIEPDCVVVMDPQKRTAGQIKGMENQQTPLLIGLTAYWGFASQYKGEKYFVPAGDHELAVEYVKNNGKEFWNTGGTVTYSAIETALRTGAKRIYLVGVDLAFPNRQSHATGTMDYAIKQTNNLVTVEGVGGTTVYSDSVFEIYRKEIEDKIASTPEITYYNLSTVGAHIEGAYEQNEF